MSERKSYDAGHFSFLEIIKVLNATAGASFAKGALVKTGISSAKHTDVIEFDTMEDFINSIETADNPITKFEGKVKHYGDNVFGLPVCPFAESIKTYVSVTGGLPEEYKEVADEMNKPSTITEKLRVGEGAAVSPFCAVHQPIRSALGERIKIGGKTLKIYQLGCKSGSGVKGVADRWVEEAGVDKSVVEKILDENMCCYVVKLD